MSDCEWDVADSINPETYFIHPSQGLLRASILGRLGGSVRQHEGHPGRCTARVGIVMASVNVLVPLVCY